MLAEQEEEGLGRSEWEDGTVMQIGDSERRPISSNLSSTRRFGHKRSFPQLLEGEEDDGNSQGNGKGSKRKKSGGGTLVDAVTILASAKIEGEEKRFEFLNRHIA